MKEYKPGDQPFGRRYLITSGLLAEGLCGPVYQAQFTDDDGSQSLVALKILADKRRVIELYFMNEERILKRARHPHIIRYVHSYQGNPAYILATEFVDACDHKAIAQQKSPIWTLKIVRQIGSALDYLHTSHPDAPMIHRDIKPDNILIDQKTGKATLIDLSVALHPFTHLEEDALLGTPPYMPPEQYLAEETPATDLYALALTAFFYLYGKPLNDLKYPKLKSDDPALIEAWKDQVRTLISKQADSIREKLAAYPQTAEVLIKATAFEPTQRHASCREFAADVERALREDGSLLEEKAAVIPVQRNYTWISAGAIGALVLVAVAILFLVGGGSASGSSTPDLNSNASSGAAPDLLPTSTLPPLTNAAENSSQVAVSSGNPLPGLAPTSTLPPNLLPTSTLPPLDAPVAASNTIVVTTREIFRAAPGNNARNLLGRNYLPVGEQLVLLSPDPTRIQGELWYQVQRVSSGEIGWVRSSSFQ